MPRWVKRLSLVGVAALVTCVGLSPIPSSARVDRPVVALTDKPTIAEVKGRIDALNHQAEIASEQLNAVREQLTSAQRRLATLQADVDRQRERVSELRAQVVGSALSDYQSSAGLSTSTAFLIAPDPQTFINDLTNTAVAQRQQADVLTQLTMQAQQLGVQEKQAQAGLDAVTDQKTELAEQQVELDDKTAEAQDLLDSLEAQQRERLRQLELEAQRQERLHQLELAAAREREADQTSAPTPATTQTAQSPTTQSPTNQSPTTQSPTTQSPTRQSPRPPTVAVSTSDRAQVAVAFALAQVGDPYVYGAAGPDAYDCSGLTMAAWAAAGVSIPHASSMQPSSGTPVSVSALQPGDLVFYYSPISHVGMYIGNGQIVHAPHTGSFVQVVPLNSMPIAMAVHIA